jgi:1,2-diacylglycerol 3-beta-galactosyltransferase
VVVRGFVNNIHEYMGASDCIVTKAGPGTIAEAMTRGLPIVLSSYLPGQEAGNVPYVVRGGFGLYPGPNPKKIASTVAKLIIDDARLKEMGNRALAAARPEATNEIAHDIGRIVLRSPDKTVSVTEFLKGK